MKTQALLMQLWLQLSVRRRWQLIVLLAVMVLASLAEVVSIGAVLPFLSILMSPQRVFDDPMIQPLAQLFNITSPVQLLLPITVLFVLAAFCSALMRLVLLWFQTRLGHAIGADFSIRIYKSTLFQPYSIHVARNSSQVIAGIMIKTNAIVGSTLLPLLTIASSLFILVTVMGALIAIEPSVALGVFAGFGGIYGLIAFFTKKRLAEDSRQINEESNQVLKALQEGLGGIRDVLIDGTQAVYCKIYRDADLPLRRSQANVQIIAAAPRFLIESLGMALIAILAYSLSSHEQGIANAIPVLGALALGAQRLLPVLQQFYLGLTAIRGGRSSLEDVLDLLAQSTPKHAEEVLPEPIPFNTSIQLKQVAFRYAEGLNWVLQGVNIAIPKGGRVGFMGTTGSGKSTLLDLVMGLLTPTEGVLAIDNVVISDRNCRSWQAHLAHVPQSIFLADATVAENIAFGTPAESIDHQRVKYAAHKAQIGSVIESWQEGYNTIVGERGIRLSGGQRQRIGIARALYKQADVIVFDEATSALDNETEKSVMRAINSIGENITILIVAHRLTTLRDCDIVVEMEHGCVKRVGSYQDIVTDIKFAEVLT